MASTPLNLGFLTVLQDNGSYLGGYLVTNVWGRPLEFRISSAVQPNKVQQILYADTLVPYVCGDLIGKTLVDKAGVPVQLVVTSTESALDLRLKVDFPVACLLSPQEMDGANIALPAGKGGLMVHPQHPGDVAAIEELLQQLNNLDLTEPFTRIREAIAEARKMGITARNAAAA